MQDVSSSTSEAASPPPRVAVVTGASGGIGGAIARRLADDGWWLVLHAHRNSAAASQLAASIVERDGQATVALADITDPAARVALVEEAFSWQGAVDAWINNAGADVLTGAAAEWNFETKLAALWRTDVESSLVLTREVGARMQSGGSIINMGWDQAATGMAGDSGELFAATKGAIMAATRSLAKSFAPKVRVNCLAPGWIKTDWGQQASDYWSERAKREALLDRWGTPEDVASAAAFLVSSNAAFITGHILPVNGGLSGYERWTERDE